MTDRITLPPSLIEDARADLIQGRISRWQPTGPDGAEVAVVVPTGFLEAGERAVLRFEGDALVAIQTRHADGSVAKSVPLGGFWNYRRHCGWLRVGGVEQGSRPEIGGRVLVLGTADSAWDTGWIGYVDRVLPSGAIEVGDDEYDGPYVSVAATVTEWAILPAEDDGMGEATAGRTIGSLNADDRGKSITTDGIPRGGKLVKIEHRSSKTGESRTLLLVHVGGGSTTVDTPSDTPCKVSDGPGEAT